MAIETISQDESQITLKLDNGDLQAIKTVLDQYSFVNEEALLRYALVSLLRAYDNKLYIKDEDGSIVSMKVSEDLIKQG